MARKNPHAVALGRRGGKIGGKVKSEAKAAAARENGKKGGRRKKLAALPLVVLLALAASGCHDIQPSPTSPTAVPSRFSLSTSAPTMFFSGSTLTITAHVSTGNGSAASNVPVTFSTTTGGTLSAASAVTNSQGDASVELTADTNVTVSAAATGLESQHLNIGAVAPFAIVLESSGLPVYTDGWAVQVRTVLNAGVASPPRPAVVRVACTLDSTAVAIPNPMVGSHWCVFGSNGVYTVSAIAILGTWATSTQITVTADRLRTPPPQPEPTPAPKPDPTPSFDVGAFAERCSTTRASWRFTATNKTVPFKRFLFDFGDGSATASTSGSEAGHDYTSDGYKTVTVTGTPADDDDEDIVRTVVILVRLAATCAG